MGVRNGAVVAAIVGGLIVVAAVTFMVLKPPQTDVQGGLSICKGTASCITGTVTRIVDGDTLDIGSTRVRLALVNTPEINEPGYTESTQFTSMLCPVGSQAIVDEDDGQPEGSYGRMIAKVSCAGKVLNTELLTAGLGDILPEFCASSEFGKEDWAIQHGC